MTNFKNLIGMKKYITIGWCLISYGLNYHDKWSYKNWNWIFKYTFEIFIIDFLEMEIARRGFDFGSFMWDVKENFSLVL